MPLMLVFPNPSRNLAIPRSTSLYPTIPRRGDPCGRPLRQSPSPHVPTPLLLPFFPLPLRCSREGGNPSRLSTSPRRGDPCGHPLRQSTSPHVPTPPLLPFFPLPLRCSREGGNPSPPSYPHLSFSRRAHPHVDGGGYPSPGPTVGAVREPPIPPSPHSRLSTSPRRGGPCGRPLRKSPSPMSSEVPRETSSPTPPLFPRRRESIPSSLPLMPNPIPQPYPPPKVPSPLMGEG